MIILKISITSQMDSFMKMTIKEKELTFSRGVQVMLSSIQLY